MSALLRIRDLSVHHGGAPALSGIDLTVRRGEIIALIGTNGAGKSTLLRAVLGLVPASGGLWWQDADMAPLTTERRARLGLGYVPEGRRVFAGMTVRENLEVAAWCGGRDRRRRLARIHDLFPALAERANSRAWQLSGGQQQMLAIGRALMGAPRLLLMDEPTLGLAPALAGDVRQAIARIAADGTAVLLAEPEPHGALTIATRGAVLVRGRLVLKGPAADLARDPDLERVILGTVG